VGPNQHTTRIGAPGGGFQSSVRINVGPNPVPMADQHLPNGFQSSVRINVGPNVLRLTELERPYKFQSSVRINVGPNCMILRGSDNNDESFNPP